MKILANVIMRIDSSEETQRRLVIFSSCLFDDPDYWCMIMLFEVYALTTYPGLGHFNKSASFGTCL